MPTDQFFKVRLVENEAEEYETDSGEEEEWWHPEVKQGEKVQVVEQYIIFWPYVREGFKTLSHGKCP